MDIMKLSSRFMRGIVSKIIKTTIKKKFGYEVDIELNEIEVKVIDGVARIHLNIDGEMNNTEFKKLVKGIGLD